MISSKIDNYYTEFYEISTDQRSQLYQIREAELYHDSDFELKLEFHISIEDYSYRHV